MIIEESVECLSCGLMWMVPIKARVVFCPRCDHRMLKIFEISFCQCGHKNISHEGFDEYGMIGKCNNCTCSRFELVWDSQQIFLKKYFLMFLDRIKKKITQYFKNKKHGVL